MQFPIFSENPLHPLQKINQPHNTTPLENQNFLIHHYRIFTKMFLPHFGKLGACQDITKSAGSQTNTNLQTMTA